MSLREFVGPYCDERLRALDSEIRIILRYLGPLAISAHEIDNAVDISQFSICLLHVVQKAFRSRAFEHDAKPPQSTKSGYHQRKRLLIFFRAYLIAPKESVQQPRKRYMSRVFCSLSTVFFAFLFRQTVSLPFGALAASCPVADSKLPRLTIVQAPTCARSPLR